jgi:predicted DNA-binding transcriptional regulator AlpA
MRAEVADVPDLLTGEQVADRIGLSRQRVQQLTGRPDFPPPYGRIGKAVTWRADDVDAYIAGIRKFVTVNGYSLSDAQVRELATRLHAQSDQLPRAASELADRLDEIAPNGGATTATGEHALALFIALDRWLGETNVDAFGEKLMNLRYTAFGDAQDAGLLKRT